MTARSSRRRGVTMVIVLAALMVVVIVAVALVRLAVSQSKRARLVTEQVQADWLVEAGFERAWARLQSNAEYQGETWEIEAQDLAGKPAVVSIAILPGKSDETRLAIQVRAEYPAGAAATVRTMKTFQALKPGVPKS
jgi:Tfp pilus assembly protein PilX